MSTSNSYYTYNFNGWKIKDGWTNSGYKDYYSSWDEKDSFARRLKNIKWRFDEPFDPHREYVEVRNGKPPKLPDSYPKGDLADLLGVGEVDDQ